MFLNDPRPRCELCGELRGEDNAYWIDDFCVCERCWEQAVIDGEVDG